MINPIARQVGQHHIGSSDVLNISAVMHWRLLIQVHKEGYMELKDAHIVFMRLGCLKDLGHYIAILRKLVKDCISLWQYVVAEEFNLGVINLLDGHCLLLKLFHDLPMEEGETHISHMHSCTSINLIVHRE